MFRVLQMHSKSFLSLSSPEPGHVSLGAGRCESWVPFPSNGCQAGLIMGAARECLLTCGVTPSMAASSFPGRGSELFVTMTPLMPFIPPIRSNMRALNDYLTCANRRHPLTRRRSVWRHTHRPSTDIPHLLTFSILAEV